MRTTGLQTHIWNNNLKSILLLLLYPILITVIVWAGSMAVKLHIEGSAHITELQGFANNIVVAYWPIIFSVVIIWFLVSYFLHTKMVRRMAHSHPVTRKDEPDLYNLTENLCIAAGMTMPRLEIIETLSLIHI